MWQDILASIATSGIITGLFVFILNKAIENKIDMKLEAYKDRLKSESARELLQLTKDLELKASERNIKLAQVFQTQADVVTTVYKQLLALQNATENLRGVAMVSEHPNKIELGDALGKANREFADYFFPNEIYLPKETANKIHKFALMLKRTLHDQYFASLLERHPSPNPASEPAREESIRRRYESLDKMEMEIPELLNSLKDDFQNILGVPIQRKSETTK
jgi:hypothetical protein